MHDRLQTLLSDLSLALQVAQGFALWIARNDAADGVQSHKMNTREIFKQMEGIKQTLSYHHTSHRSQSEERRPSLHKIGVFGQSAHYSQSSTDLSRLENCINQRSFVD